MVGVLWKTVVGSYDVMLERVDAPVFAIKGGVEFGGCYLLLGCVHAHGLVIKRAVLRRLFVSK